MYIYSALWSIFKYLSADCSRMQVKCSGGCWCNSLECELHSTLRALPSSDQHSTERSLAAVWPFPLWHIDSQLTNAVIRLLSHSCHCQNTDQYIYMGHRQGIVNTQHKTFTYNRVCSVYRPLFLYCSKNEPTVSNLFSNSGVKLSWRQL